MSPKTIQSEVDRKKDKIKDFVNLSNEVNRENDNPLIESISDNANEKCNTEYIADQTIGSSSKEIDSKNLKENDFLSKDVHEWEFELEWSKYNLLKNVLDSFSHVIMNTNKSCPDLQATNELLKYKDSLILTLSKLPFKASNETTTKSNADDTKINKTINDKIIKVLGRDLMIEIENQLIKNGHYLVIQNEDFIDEDNKKKLIEQNNNLICKLVNLKNEIKLKNKKSFNDNRIIEFPNLDILIHLNEEYVTIECKKNTIKLKRIYLPIIILFLTLFFLLLFGFCVVVFCNKLSLK